MKSNLLTLARILLKNGSNNQGKKGIKGKKWSQWILIGIIILAFLPMVGQFIFMTSAGYDILKPSNSQGIILSLGLTLSAFVIFFFGIFYILNTFYFTNDVENLLPLPVRPSEIIGAKFIVVGVYEYLTELIFVLPILVTYGIKSGSGIVYYLYCIIIFLILPVIPLVIDSILIMPLMRFTGIAKNKDRFRFISGIIALVIGMVANVGVQKFTSRANDMSQLPSVITQANDSLVGVTSRIFPSSKFASLGLIHSGSFDGVINIVLFLLISAAAFAVFLLLGELLYFKGVMGVSEVSSRRKKISREELEKGTVKNSALKSYLMKELRLLFRTPIYFMNCILMNFLWPVLFAIPLLTQSKGSGNLEKLSEFLKDGSISGAILAGGFGAMLFIASSNGVTSTSISREGQYLFIAKFIPVNFRDQIMAKVLSGVIISLIGMVTMMIAALFILKIQLYLIILIIVAGFFALFFSSFTGIIIDLWNPKLNWDNEQKAVKQNLNLLFNMIVSVIFAAVTILIAVLFSLTIVQVFAGIVVLFGLLNSLLYLFIASKGEKLFLKIEN